MTAGSRGLGRGLDSLFGNGADAAPTAMPLAGAAQSGQEPLKVKLSALAPNPQQPRRHFSEQQMEELTASIKAQGILQPILARPLTKSQDGTQNTYEIIAGERRWRAAQKAGLVMVPVVVREMSDQEALIVALMENLQREDLTPMEEALGLQQLKDEFGLSQEDMALRLGKSRSAVANTLRLLALPEAAREDLMEGRISAGHARALLMVSDPESRETFRRYMTEKNCSVREAENIAALWKETGALPADLLSGEKQAAAKPARPEPDEDIVELQEKLARLLQMPVSIKGGETKGSINIKYRTQEELEELLEKFGLEDDG